MSGDSLWDGLLPFALRFQDQLDYFAGGAFASCDGGDVMRGAFDFDDGVGDGDSQADAAENREVGQIVADVGDFFVGDAGADEDGFVRLEFFWLALYYEFHSHFAGAAGGSGRVAAGDQSGANAHDAGELDTGAVVRVENFHLGDAVVWKCLKADYAGG